MKNNKTDAVKRGIRFSLGRKLTAAFFAVSLLVGVTAGAAYMSMKKLERNYASLLEKQSAANERASKIETGTQLQNSLLFGYLVEPVPEKEELLFKGNGELGTLITTTVSASEDDEREQAVRLLSESNDTFARLLVKVQDYIKQNRPDLAKAEALMWSIPLTDTMNHAAKQLREAEKAALQNELNRYRKASEATTRTLILCSAAALIIAVSIGILLTRLIVRPMAAMVRTAGEMASGDLTAASVEVKNRDEIRELASAFHTMKSSWHGMISELGRHAGRVAHSAEKLRQQSDQFRSSSEQISAIMEEISVGSEEQAQSAELGVSKVEGMSAGVAEITALAGQADRQSAHALQETAAGERIVALTADQMKAIQQKMNELTAFIERLDLRTGQIVDAAALIEHISRQTQMLALNASIEAARAGEAGKGFAVVANEVRKLSVQTGTAASEVQALVDGVRNETGLVVEAAKAGSLEVAAGLTKVGQAGEAFFSIRQAVEEAAGQIGRVLEQAERLYRQSDDAVDAIRSIDRVAQQTADGSREVYAHTEEQHAGVQEMTAAMDGLSLLSEELQGMIGKFKV
ncbi:methyl-accepting chemotaxis protein [Paenibacillus harenae]|uniref:methyl-accepting chemotaxis protein n=1 Tax=Paenibacillus harenae TaxID=306543 RepID=UPI00042534E5|nr:methyl-accepting chemotaxis protein [Paenibacillus harenae]